MLSGLDGICSRQGTAQKCNIKFSVSGGGGMGRVAVGWSAGSQSVTEAQSNSENSCSHVGELWS